MLRDRSRRRWGARPIRSARALRRTQRRDRVRTAQSSLERCAGRAAEGDGVAIGRARFTAQADPFETASAVAGRRAARFALLWRRVLRTSSQGAQSNRSRQAGAPAGRAGMIGAAPFVRAPWSLDALGASLDGFMASRPVPIECIHPHIKAADELPSAFRALVCRDASRDRFETRPAIKSSVDVKR